MSGKTLVEIRGRQALTTSEAVADGCGVQHESVIRLVRRYRSDFEELGEIAFETRKGFSDLKSGNPGGRPSEYAVLNEDQATCLITLFRNSPIVRRFKVTLVKAFRRALNQISRDFANPPREGLITAKRASNRPMPDALIEAREADGKATDARQFMSEARLCNWALTGRFEGVDESALSNHEVTLLEAIRDRNRAYLLAGLDYPARKARLCEFATRQRAKGITYQPMQEVA